MPCGCVTAGCGCNIVAGANITVVRLGDKFTISTGGNIGVPTFIQQAPPGVAGPYVWYETDGLGNIVTEWIETGP